MTHPMYEQQRAEAMRELREILEALAPYGHIAAVVFKGDQVVRVELQPRRDLP